MGCLHNLCTLYWSLIQVNSASLPTIVLYFFIHAHYSIHTLWLMSMSKSVIPRNSSSTATPLTNCGVYEPTVEFLNLLA